MMSHSMSALRLALQAYLGGKKVDELTGADKAKLQQLVEG